MKLITAFLLLFIFQFSFYSQSLIEEIKSLHLEKSEAGLTAYYSEGSYERAEEVKFRLKNSAEYFEKTFAIEENFSIAILNEEDWKKVSKIPYGLPFVSGPPYIVVFPADLNNELGNLVLESLAEENLDQKYTISNEEIAYRFISLIGFHELGHIYSKASGIDFPNKWTFEFAATYFAYLYLLDNSVESKNLWLDVAHILEEEISPTYTTLKDFEELYVRVGVENYAWYQVIFLERVAEVADQNGKDFIYDLIKSDSLTKDNFSLDELEKLESGFIKWAEIYGLSR